MHLEELKCSSNIIFSIEEFFPFSFKVFHKKLFFLGGKNKTNNNRRTFSSTIKALKVLNVFLISDFFTKCG